MEKSENKVVDFYAKSLQRRSFLKAAGVTATAALVVSGCSYFEDGETTIGKIIDLGTGDTGILNYAYTLEQLEAAFYEKVVTLQKMDSMFAYPEKRVLTDVKAHESIHREFFKKALGKNAIGDLSFDFSSIDFDSKESILKAARDFEDLGVAAYNGAGKLLKDPNLLLIAGKIVSVEARHAAAIRDLIDPRSANFSGDDIVDPMTGLDKALSPDVVLLKAAKYIKVKISAKHLPTT
jgi:rubrerythrin